MTQDYPQVEEGQLVTYNLYNIVAKASQGQQFNRVRGVNSF